MTLHARLARDSRGNSETREAEANRPAGRSGPPTPDGHVTASMAVTAPDEGSHAKVLNRTSFQESPSLCLPRKYKVYLLDHDGLNDLVFSLSLPRGSWSRKHPRCLGCGTQERPHGRKGLCGRCSARKWAREYRTTAAQQ